MDTQSSSSLTPPVSKRPKLESDGDDCIVLEDKEDCYIVKSSVNQSNKELAEDEYLYTDCRKKLQSN